MLAQFRYFGFNFSTCCVCYRDGVSWCSTSAKDEEDSVSTSRDPASTVFQSFSSAKGDEDSHHKPGLVEMTADGTRKRVLRSSKKTLGRRLLSSSRSAIEEEGEGEGEGEKEGQEEEEEEEEAEETNRNHALSSNGNGQRQHSGDNDDHNKCSMRNCVQAPAPGRYNGAMEGAGMEEVICLECVRWSLLARFVLVVLFIGGGAGFAIYAPQMVISEEFELASPRDSSATAGYNALTTQCKCRRGE